MGWGFAALVVAATSPPKPPLSQEKADALIEGWSVATTRAHGAVVDAVQVSRDEWDEERLRALCDQHGWEFEWMTEDGEWRRRACEVLVNEPTPSLKTPAATGVCAAHSL